MIVVLGAAIDLLRIKSDLEGGRDALTGLSLERLNGGLVDTIDGAADRLDRAQHRASTSLFLKPFTVVPLVRDQVDALRDLTGVTATIGRTGRRAATAIDKDLEASSKEPRARLELLHTMSTELDRIQDEVEHTDVGARGHLIGPLRTARQELVAELAKVPSRFDEARGYIDALTGLLGGPTRYLVLAANNAEMRGGAGMPLSGGVVTFADGDVSFGDFEPLANRHVAGTPDLLPQEWAQTYAQFKMGVSWVQTAVSPNFPTVAPVYAAMSAQFPTGPVDGVLEVDAVALRALLEVIGPVDYDGQTYTADNIEAKVLHDNYLAFDTVEERDQRQEVQGQLAKAIFDALKTRDFEIADLALGLRQAALGRHLLAYASDPAMQALWTDIGATGELPPTGLMVTVQNIAANKLDYFIRPRVTVTGFPDTATQSWKVRVTVTITNPDGVATNAYIDGTHPLYRDALHRAMVAVYVPKKAFGFRNINDPVSEEGLDPPLQMTATRVLVPRGDTVRTTFEFSLPIDQVGVVVLPSGRVNPVDYEVNGIRFTDAVATPAFWVSDLPPEPTAGAPGVAGVLSLAGALAVLVGVRARLRVAGTRPLRALPDLLQRAPSFGAVLFLAAIGALIAGALISSAT